MKTRVYTAATLLLLTLAVSSWGPARGNGMIFFEAQAETVITGTIYFGTVLDDRSRPVAGALVSIYLQSENIEFVVRTGVDGRYRNASIRKDVEPALVTVTVVRPGFRLVRAVPRTTALRPGLTREINFVLAPT